LRHAGDGRLRLATGSLGDMSLFEEVLACLEAGKAASHTPSGTWSTMRLELEGAGGARHSIDWPDYGGESLDKILATRAINKRWMDSLAAADAWMLMLRPGSLQLKEDLLDRP